MSQESVQVGAFEAKTRLAELLRETEQGRSFVILRRGKAVARLVPISPAENESDYSKIKDDFSRIRGQVKGKLNIKKLIEEGRRY
jgi:prevent-host-death family protein